MAGRQFHGGKNLEPPKEKSLYEMIEHEIDILRDNMNKKDIKAKKKFNWRKKEANVLLRQSLLRMASCHATQLISLVLVPLFKMV